MPQAFLDAVGTPITVGATVKLVGKVTALNQDPHYGSVTITPTYPTVANKAMESGGGNPQSPNFPVPNQQEPAVTYGFEPLQLLVGS